MATSRTPRASNSHTRRPLAEATSAEPRSAAVTTVDDVAAGHRVRQPGPSALGEHGVGVDEVAGGVDEHVGGGVERHAEVARLHVVLAHAEVGVGVPAVDVVVDGDGRVPVAEVVHLAVGPLAVRPGVRGDRVRPAEGDLGGGPRRQRLHQPDRHDGAEHGVRPRLDGAAVRARRLGPGDVAVVGAVDGERRQRQAAGDGDGPVPGHARRVDVLAQLEHQELEGVRGLVGVRDGPGPAQHGGLGVEPGVEVVVGPVLPVGGARRAGGGPGPLGHGALERRRRRDGVRLDPLGRGRGGEDGRQSGEGEESGHGRVGAWGNVGWPQSSAGGDAVRTPGPLAASAGPG